MKNQPLSPSDLVGLLFTPCAFRHPSSSSTRLQTHEIPSDGETAYPRGGSSIYFRDSDDHLPQLATSGLWFICLWS